MLSPYSSRWPRAFLAVAVVCFVQEASAGNSRLLSNARVPPSKGERPGLLSAHDIGSAIGPAVVTAYPQGAANENPTPPCGSSAGAGSDFTYLWTAPVTGTYIFRTSAPNFDTLLYIRDSSGNPLGCIASEASALVVDV